MIKTTAGITACFLITACASIDPPRNYVAQSNDAKLTFRSVNMPMEAGFSVSSSPKPCEGFERVGLVRDGGRQVLLPWIANLSDRLNRIPTSLEARAPSGKELQVKGLGSWFNGASRSSCGPLAAKFVPIESGSYLVEFVWSGTSACSMRVSNVTIPDKPELVPTQRLACSRG